MNEAENDGGAKAIDSLLNYETVKVGRRSGALLVAVCPLTVPPFV